MDNQDKRKLEELFADFLHHGLERISFGNPVDREHLQKVKCRPVFLRGKFFFQIEELRGKQAFHKNLAPEEARAYLIELCDGAFRQCELWADGQWAQILVSKKGKITIKKKKIKAENLEISEASEKEPRKIETGKTGISNFGKEEAETKWLEKDTEVKKWENNVPEKGEQGKGKAKICSRKDAETGKSTGELDLDWVQMQKFSHNRIKRYILEEGIPIPFLVDLGVMTKDGKVIRAKYDKFRQINRYLEFIEDILPQLSLERENRILDFGCGKSYLTFALYYYLKEVKNYPIRVIGLDLKKEVIEHCRQLGRKYGFTELDFCCGDIASYQETERADMVVTLHACDTATDFALAKAVNWGAKVILSVPCCQHEWNKRMDNELMAPVLRYGLLKERMAALLTDGVRAEVLEYMGYRTQILEFIAMEHTPKNILIRAVYQGKTKNNGEKIKELLEFWGVEPTLVKMLAPEILA